MMCGECGTLGPFGENIICESCADDIHFSNKKKLSEKQEWKEIELQNFLKTLTLEQLKTEFDRREWEYRNKGAWV
jgi:hypothetical protein